jgi:class 3 adenylate cyclase
MMVGRLRTRTILFTDIVASTETFHALDERSAEQLREAHLAALNEQVEHHGGRTVKTLGDGLMAVFDAAKPAIECGIDLQRDVRLGRAGSRGRRREAAVQIRVGISTGDVRERVNGDCHGGPVVEASRLCARAGAQQVLLADATRLAARDFRHLREVGQIALKGLGETTLAWEAQWSADEARPTRVILADDAVLVRQGIAEVLETDGIEVMAQVDNADDLLRLVAELRPDVAIVDIRMPPTFTLEGIVAATRIRTEHPNTAVLVLSQDAQPVHARRLQEASPIGVGLMLKERVSDIAEFTRAVRTVAAGGVAIAGHALA